MRTWARWTARAAMLSASFAAAGTGTVGLAFAGTTSVNAASVMSGGWHTSGNHSILGGNQIKVPIEIPINACGNALALLGDAFAGCRGGAHVGGHHHHGGQSWHTSGNHSILGGNQIKVPVKVPVNVCGNSAAVLGLAASGCRGGAGAAGGGGGWHTSGNHSILGGNQIKVPVKIPINACGNALALLGDAFAGCKGGARVHGGHHESWHTSGNHSIGGGNQVKVPVKVPVNVCGNSGAVLGLAASGCRGGAGTAGGGNGWRTSGDESIGGGNQGKAAVKAPVNVCSTAVALLGDAFAGCKGGAHVGGGHHSQTWHTSGNNSILGGNQVKVPVKVPVNVCGNSAAVLGDAFAGCKGGATVDRTSASHINHVRVAHTSARALSLTQPLGGKSIIQQPGGALAGLSSLPLLSSLPTQTAQLTSYSTANASLLSTGNAAPGMGSGSLLGLVMGALLAGAASLVAAGRRFGVRRASR